MCLANETLCAFIMCAAPLSLVSSVKCLAFYSCRATPLLLLSSSSSSPPLPPPPPVLPNYLVLFYSAIYLFILKNICNSEKNAHLKKEENKIRNKQMNEKKINKMTVRQSKQDEFEINCLLYRE